MQVLAIVASVLTMITAFVCNNLHGFFLISMVTTGLVLYLFWKYHWWKALIIILFLTYFISLIWLLNNPVSLVKTPNDLTYYYAFFYFSIITAMYSLVVFKKPNDLYPENLILSTILSAGLAYSILLLLLVF